MNTKIQRLSGTIAAQSSAQGASGVAVIRVSGSAVKTIIKKTIKKELGHMKAELTAFHDQNGNVVDQVIALFFQSPSSYTGEDVLEISCHGSIAVADEILRSLYQQGARPANASSSIKPPRAQLINFALLFILLRTSIFTKFSVSGVRGKCKVT